MAVLIVEDNPQVRASLSRILTRTGFEVDEAENGLAALSMVERRTYQVVICDIKMPVMDGVRMYELLERAYPAVARRVVFVSAWFDDADVRGFLEGTGRPFLQKPFDMDAFVRTVRAVAEDAQQEATSGRA
ncbi:MAG TPA: response regulator [Gemmatimonadales bacterium]|nr:response regulator [Gemmatimonadales bacterium]